MYGETLRPWRAWASIVAPLLDTQTLVTSFRVPQGARGELGGLVLNYNGTGNEGGFIDGSGDITWDAWIHPGGTTEGGYLVDGYAAVTHRLGNLVQPWLLRPGFPLESDDTVAVYVTINSVNVAVGAPNYVTCILMGATWIL